jgi:CelD/BcsL family acetyltransferase involved in cellulose biosynthesis
LLEQCDANTLFLTWEWINCWQCSQIKEIKPLIIVIEESGVVIAIAPFYICQYQLFQGIRYQALRCLGDKNSGAEYSNFIAYQPQSPLLKKMLWEALLSTQVCGLWDFIWLHNIASWTEGGRTLIGALSEVGKLKIQQRNQEFAYCSLIKKDIPVLLQVGKSLRKNIKQTTRRLDKLGTWKIACCNDATELEYLLEQFFNLHQKRWYEKGQQGSFQRSLELQDFYRHFVPFIRISACSQAYH